MHGEKGANFAPGAKSFISLVKKENESPIWGMNDNCYPSKPRGIGKSISKHCSFVFFPQAFILEFMNLLIKPSTVINTVASLKSLFERGSRHFAFIRKIGTTTLYHVLAILWCHYGDRVSLL